MIIVRIFFTLLILLPIGLGIRNLVLYRKVKVTSPSYRYLVLNSAIHFAIAWNIIFFLQEVFLVVGKYSLGLTSYLYHNNHSWDGYHEMQSLMQGSGAAAIFLFGWLFYLLFLLFRRSSSPWKLLLLWLAFHGLLQSTPQVMVAYFQPQTDVGQALIGYLKLSESTMVFLAVLSTALTGFFSYFLGKYFLDFYEGPNDDPSKLNYIRSNVGLAALLGSILVIPFRIFPWSQILAPFIVSVFTIPWTWSTIIYHKPPFAVSTSLTNKVHWGAVAFLLLLILFFQIVLAPGLVFG